MSDNIGQNQFQGDRRALLCTRAIRILMPLQKNNHLTVDLLEKGTLKNEETNPMFQPPSQPETCTRQPFAMTTIAPAVRPKFREWRQDPGARI
jgi:hypothetical protein